MSNKNISDYVAAAMDAALKSEAHQSLFGTQYKYASDQSDAKDKCSKCGDKCSCGDTMMADDQDAKKKKELEDSSSADDQDAKKKKDSEDSSSDSKDSSSADDLSVSAAFDVAIDSLLTASAALDQVGLEKSSAFSLKLATLVVEAKKKEKDSKKSKKSDSKSDSNAAKDKLAKEKEKEKAAKEKEKAKKEKDTQAAKDKALKEKEKEKAAKEKERLAKEKAKSSKK